MCARLRLEPRVEVFCDLYKINPSGTSKEDGVSGKFYFSIRDRMKPLAKVPETNRGSEYKFFWIDNGEPIGFPRIWAKRARFDSPWFRNLKESTRKAIKSIEEYVRWPLTVPVVGDRALAAQYHQTKGRLVCSGKTHRLFFAFWFLC